MIKKIFFAIFKSISILSLFIFVLIFGGLTALFVFQNLFSVPDTIVPSVIGDHFEIAQEKIYDAGLRMVISGEEFNNQLDKNMIINQKPLPGNIIKENREVNVTISKGVKLVSINIPDLKNKNIDDAASIIEDHGLVLGRVTRTNHFSIPKDQVIAQVPKPGEILTDNKMINLLVSNGNY